MKQGWLWFWLCVLATASGCPASSSSPDGPSSGTCGFTSECGGGRVCIAGVCRAPMSIAEGGVCTATRDCQNGLYCHSVTGRCVPGGGGVLNSPCLQDGQCTAGLRCNFTGFTGVCTETEDTELGDSCSRQTDCLAGLYCGATGSCNRYAAAFPTTSLTCNPDTGPFRSYFVVPRAGATGDFYRLPYPNDIRVSASGDLDLSGFPRPGPTPLGPDLVGLYVDALVEDFDGFSTVAPVAFRFSKNIDFPFLRDNGAASIVFWDVTANAGVGSFGFNYTPLSSRYFCENYLSVYPSLGEAPLRAGHTYMILILSVGLRSATGEAPAQEADLAAMLASSRPTGDEPLAHAWDAYAPMRTTLETHFSSLSRATIMNAAVFTVADPKIHMQRLAAAVAAQPAPVLSGLYQCGVSTGADPCDDGTMARQCPAAADPAFVEIHGKVRLPIFQSGTAPYNTPADGGGLNQTGGSVTKVRDEEVCFALTMPTGTPPAAGWPLVIHGHGTGGSFRSFIADGVAKELATASTKTAVMGIDLVGHGARRAGSTRPPEELVFNVLNPRAARDNFAQGAADLLTLFRVPSSPAPSGWSGPQIKFAPRVVLFGHSQGATHGELALPFTNDAPAAVLSGAGANLTASLLNKTSPQNVRDGLVFLLQGAIDFNHPVMVLWQNFFDRVDPANFNRHITSDPLGGRPAKHVLMTWGRQDTFSPDDTLHQNATFLVASPIGVIRDDAGGQLSGIPGTTLPAPIPRPATLSSVKAVVIQYDPASGEDGHFVAFRVAAAIADWKAFITSFFATGTPTIP